MSRIGLDVDNINIIKIYSFPQSAHKPMGKNGMKKIKAKDGKHFGEFACDLFGTPRREFNWGMWL